MNKIFLSIIILLTAINSFAIQKVTLQLKWFHQFQFAGYYVAKEKGYYKDVGLDVTIKERDLKYNNIEEVINNKAQYGVADSVLFLYKARNEPIITIAPIFQHSANILISRKDKNIQTIEDLNNKKVIFYPNDADGFSLLALLKKFNVDAELIRNREKGDYKKIINKQADLMPAYLTNEPFLFKEAGVDIDIINPMNYGLDIYGDMLFTNKNEALNYPNRVKNFKEASLKGWKYALENKEETIQLILEKYNSKKSIEHLKYEAKAIESLISKDLIPLGSIDKGRVQYINNLYIKYGLMNSKLDINDFIFEEYVNSKGINLTNEEKQYLVDNPTISVLNMKAFAPYNFNISNQAKGYSIEYMKLLANILNIKLEFKTIESWAKSLDMIKEGSLDIIPHIAINEERKKYIDYTNFTHINFSIALAVNKSSKINSLEDLNGKTLSILDNTFFEEIIRKKYPKIRLLTTKTVKEAIDAVSNGTAHATIENLSTLEYHINNYWLSNLKTIKLNKDSGLLVNIPLYMGVKKGNKYLKSILEKANAYVKPNEVTKLKSEWLIKNLGEHVNLNKNEYEYLRSKKNINYCIDPNWMPLDKIEENKHIGLSSEYIKIFEEKLGVTFNLIKTNNWTSSLESIKNENCELIPFIYKTKERENILNISKAYLSFPLVVATKMKEPFIGDLKTLRKRKVSYVKDYAYEEVLKDSYPLIDFIEVSSIHEGLNMVQKNQVYAHIGLLPTIGYQIQKNFSNSLKIAGEVQDDWPLSLAIKKDNELLTNIMKKVLDSISEKKKESLFNKYSSVTYEESIDLKKIFYLISFFLIVIGIVIYKNRQINILNQNMKKYIKIIDEHVLTSSTNKKGIITQASKAFCKISGYDKKELLGQNHNIIRHEEMPKEIFKQMWKTISKGQTWKGEIKNKTKDGNFYWVEANISPIFNEKKQITGYTSIRHDITDKKRVEELSITDELTGLYNRRHFNKVFEKEINRAKRDDNNLALIIFDVDCFKQYNDNYGHPKGDIVLKEIGRVIKTLAKRSSDYAFRIGGEEFAIIFTPHVKETAVNFAEMIREGIQNLQIEHEFNKASNYITVSIGLYSENGDKIEDAESIYNHTDDALYKAKESGRNKFVLYEKK
ncbi:hypothetical protein CRV02_00400 [Arcobacter sp. CECT 8989]|uniref:diguanylate cyclase n=1 Tax=Arcobacter sp. CECT 8989 TaxID=2044509 RepID=UPI00100A6D26|nr:transporter substrate-binding domain-containing protein [Arcobacter sp. CECT 8989]RXK03691.1 hypothetical protein CRV02_00400 [Arcobacter sp. CECT 8989]